MTFSTAYNNNGYVFIGANQDHTCITPENNLNWTTVANNKSAQIVYSAGKRQLDFCARCKFVFIYLAEAHLIPEIPCHPRRSAMLQSQWRRWRCRDVGSATVINYSHCTRFSQYNILYYWHFKTGVWGFCEYRCLFLSNQHYFNNSLVESAEFSRHLHLQQDGDIRRRN